MYNQSLSYVTSHDVYQMCRYTQWASREVLCDRNYMEVGCFRSCLHTVGCVWS